MPGKRIVKDVFGAKGDGVRNERDEERQEDSDKKSRKHSLDFFGMLEFHGKNIEKKPCRLTKKTILDAL